MSRVVVFWEDSFSAKKDFAPHVLALQCIVDRRPEFGTRYVLGKRVEAIASRGVDKLLTKVRLTEERLVVAIPDNDKIRRHINLDHDASVDQVLNMLASTNPRATFVLLEPNVEGVVEFACRVLRLPIPTRKQPPDERDRPIFQLAAEQSPDQRQNFLNLMPSFNQVVEAIETKLDGSQD